MKITETNNEKTVKFDSLKKGDVFKLRHDKNHYMKMERCETGTIYADSWYIDTYDCSWRNAVNLFNGNVVKICGNELVIPVDCELVVK